MNAKNLCIPGMQTEVKDEDNAGKIFLQLNINIPIPCISVSNLVEVGLMVNGF